MKNKWNEEVEGAGPLHYSFLNDLRGSRFSIIIHGLVYIRTEGAGGPFYLVGFVMKTTAQERLIDCPGRRARTPQ